MSPADMHGPARMSVRAKSSAHAGLLGLYLLLERDRVQPAADKLGDDLPPNPKLYPKPQNPKP